MGKTLSPLRYPGGKTKIYNKVKKLIEHNNWKNTTYVEPFAGGFGIGIGLLCDEVVNAVVINDIDSHIYHFWDAVLNQTDELITLIENTEVTIDERTNQKAAYEDPSTDALHDGFATLYLNRVNYSGVIKGGPIGGAKQQGKYKINCRFNKPDIIERIRCVARFRDRITLYNCDASELIIRHVPQMDGQFFLNIDPPYVIKGSLLYTNYFEEQDHRNLANVIVGHLTNVPWIITYDDAELIREIYAGYLIQEYNIQHNVGTKARNTELVISNIHPTSFIW